MAPSLGRDRTGVSDDTTRKSQNHPEALGAAPAPSRPPSAHRGCARHAGPRPTHPTAPEVPGLCPTPSGRARRTGLRPLGRSCARRVRPRPRYRGRARCTGAVPDAVRLRPTHEPCLLCRGWAPRARTVLDGSGRARGVRASPRVSQVCGRRIRPRSTDPSAPEAPRPRAAPEGSGARLAGWGRVRVVRLRGVPRSGGGPSGRGRRRPGHAGRRRAGRPRRPPAARRRPCGRRP